MTLSEHERQLIRLALEFPAFVDRMTEPQTPRIVRDVWRGLRERLKTEREGVLWTPEDGRV